MHFSPISTKWARFVLNGFTLIEMLVVIAILGILAALLLPVLSSAKSRGAQAVDINNLKQIITAVDLYYTDDSGVLPWPNWGNKPLRSGWLYAWNPSAGGAARFSIQKGLLWPTLLNGKLFFCPLDNTNTFLFRQRQQRLSSYVMNGGACGYARAIFPAEKVSNLKPDDVIFWEADETQPQYFNDGANLPSEGVSGRHINGALISKLDGSVSYIRLGAWYVQAYETNRNSVWCYPGTVNGR